jgi:uncharacterized protein
MVEVEFDPAKDAANRLKHGVSLASAAAFDFEKAFVMVDDRFDYGETRYRAYERIDGKGFCLVFVIVGTNVRAISLRNAHEKEMRRYGR